MASTQRLELRQSQSLVMTPQLQQAIKLLQLSNLELAAYVDGELERNPLLEQDGVEATHTEGAETRPDDPPQQHETTGEADSLTHLSDPPRQDARDEGPLDLTNLRVRDPWQNDPFGLQEMRI